MHKSILVVVSHPDDEVLGCGGTIAKHVEKGDIVNLAIMTDGVGARLKTKSSNVKSRIKALNKSKFLLGISKVYRLKLKDNSMDKIPLLNIIQKLEKIIKKTNPTIIYTHHHGDLNIDHRITQAAVMTACRPIPESNVSEIYGFEVLSSTEWANSPGNLFNPTLFIDVSKYFNTKLKALDAYSEEMRKAPHSRSISHVKILAKHRGYSVGIDLAEAFEVYRLIK